jgi:hypothetical protein
MPTVPNPLSELGILPLAAKALKEFRARDEVRTLLSLVDADVRHSDLLPFGAATEILERLHDLMVQPEIAGALARWLSTGDKAVRQPLELRLAQLLVFDGIDSQQLAALIVASVDRNLLRAKRNDREALLLEGQRTRAEINQLKEQVADVASSLSPSAPLTARALQLARATVQLGPSEADTIEKLASRDPHGAVAVQEALEVSGARGVADAIENSRPWLQHSSAAVWEAVGRIAESTGRIRAAQQAYERAADHPGVEDRARQLVRASSAAALQEDPARERELLDTARSEDPDNAAVLLRLAQDVSDPDEKLALLDCINAVDDDQRASLEVSRAEALIAKCEFEPARAAIRRTRNLQADPRGPDELEATVVLSEAQAGISDEHELPFRRLIGAAETFERLADDMRDRERWYGVAILAGRAIHSFALGGNRSEAGRLMDETLADERLLRSDDARRLLASAALLLQRLDDVLDLVPADDDEGDRLDRAAAHVMSGDPARSASVAGELSELMRGAGEQHTRAAFLLLCASTNNAAVKWDTDAERIVAEEQPWMATMLKAFRLATEGNLTGAEAHLRPHTDNPTALRYLIDLAGRLDEHEKARLLAETLVQRTGAPADRLLLATVLTRTGQTDIAIERLIALGRDQSASFDDRSSAYARAALLAQAADQFAQLETISREWAEMDDSADPRWGTVLALAMQFRHSDAMDAWRDLGEPEANSIPRARLLGEVFALAAEPETALEIQAALSDRFERPEELEAMLMYSAVRLESETPEIAPELLARVRESFSTFPERFPESPSFRAFPIDPENPAASLLAALGDQLKRKAESTQQLATGIAAGTSAVAMLAAAATRSIGETLFLLPALPIGYPTDQFEALDRTDAAAAYAAGGAVWDASAIFVVASLEPELQQTIRNALPASRVARATQQDTARDLLGSASSDRGEISVVDGTIAVGCWPEAARRANDRRGKEMQRLAAELPGHSPAASADGDELLTIATNAEAPTAIRSWAGTLTLARSEGLSIFSDDRVVRRGARELGLKTFGTMAVMGVLADQGVVTAQQRDDVRHRLLTHGAWGARHTTEELANLAREANWQPTSGLRVALGDSSAWVTMRGVWAERILGLLDAVAKEAPEHMDSWVHRAVDAATYDVGGDYLGHAKLLLLGAINPVTDPLRMSDAGLRALIASLRRMRYFEVFRPPEDLLIIAVGELLTITDDRTLQAMLFRRVLDRLVPEHQELLRRRFVQ